MLLAVAAYHHTIAGEVVTVIVCTSMAVYGIGVAVKNFARR